MYVGSGSGDSDYFTIATPSTMIGTPTVICLSPTIYDSDPARSLLSVTGYATESGSVILRATYDGIISSLYSSVMLNTGTEMAFDIRY